MSTTPNGAAVHPAAALKARIEAARKAAPSERLTIEIGEASVEVEVRAMAGGAKAHLLDEGYKDGEYTQPILRALYPLVIAYTLHDPTSGARIFDTSPESLAAISDLPFATMEQLGSAGIRVSALTRADKEAAGNASGSTATAPSDSPSPES